MKTSFLLLLCLAASLNLHAQLQFSVQAVAAEEVPQAVHDAQAGFFPGITVNVWEKQSASARSKSGDRYVANFQKDGQKSRARYYANGKGISATTYYTAKELPEVIRTAAAENYAAYQLTSGEAIQVLNQQKSFFRLRLRKGAQKLVVYVDANGQELSKDSIPEEVVEEGLAE